MTGMNRLANAKSPYLLQHASNPVDWYEWGAEAFEKAKRENKPVFLSVGYSACHWCHVLAHESFEDEVTAKLMNEHYVNIKVDREERPDVDHLYMTFLQATSGGGGWPMSVWLTSDLHPFFAGTYFPQGQFRQILVKLAEIWEEEPERCIATGKQIIDALRSASDSSSSKSPSISQEHAIESAGDAVYKRLKRIYDPTHGGFGGAPKFPSPSQTVHFLARFSALSGQTEDARQARDMAVSTMIHIYNGGIRDVVGDGFSRYSVDERWHVPHFEKMLYDQGQLLSSALELANLLPSDAKERRTLQSMAHSILTYVARDLRAPEGAFYSAEDADSLPGKGSTVKKEGAFYVWTASEVDSILGPDAELFKYHYGVKPEGNCDPKHDIRGELRGQNVLYTAHTIDETASQYSRTVEETTAHIGRCISTLKDHRDKERPRPHLDDKILCGWNGLLISGLSKASETLDESVAPYAVTRADALRLAEDAAEFIKQKLYDSEVGTLQRSWREGPGPKGQADDYAFLIQGLLDLYEASGKEEYAIWAVRLQDKQDELFYDEAGGGYFTSAPDEHILVRMKDAQDGAEPSAASVTLSNLYRLAHVAEDKHELYTSRASSILQSNAHLLTQAPHALASMVSAAMCGSRGYRQFIVTGSPSAPATTAFLEKIRAQFVPHHVLLHVDPANPPKKLSEINETVKALVEEVSKRKDGADGVKPNVRLCESYVCAAPVYDVEALQV